MYSDDTSDIGPSLPPPPPQVMRWHIKDGQGYDSPKVFDPDCDFCKQLS